VVSASSVPKIIKIGSSV